MGHIGTSIVTIFVQSTWGKLVIIELFGAFALAQIWKLFLFILLCLGSLLWVISIIAVLWGISDGLIPAIRAKEYKKASIILVIILITIAVILLSVINQAIYLIGFILPILLVQVYIKKYIELPSSNKHHFRNN